MEYLLTGHAAILADISKNNGQQVKGHAAVQVNDVNLFR